MAPHGNGVGLDAVCEAHFALKIWSMEGGRANPDEVCMCPGAHPDVDLNRTVSLLLMDSAGSLLFSVSRVGQYPRCVFSGVRSTSSLIKGSAAAATPHETTTNRNIRT